MPTLSFPSYQPQRRHRVRVGIGLIAAGLLAFGVFSANLPWFGQSIDPQLPTGAVGAVQNAGLVSTESTEAKAATPPLNHSGEPSRVEKLFASLRAALFPADSPPPPQPVARVEANIEKPSGKVAQRSGSKKRSSNKQKATAKRLRQQRAARAQLARLGIPVNKQSLLNSVEEGNTQITRLLLRAGISPNAKGGQGWTPLMVAAREAHAEVVSSLVTRGAQVNVRDKTGRTALMYAAENGQPSIVDTLLRKGANPHIRDNEGRTAIMYATQPKSDRAMAQFNASAQESTTDYQSVIKLLQQAGSAE